MFVDSHCHLSSPELAGRIPEIRAAMRAASVDRALCICTTLDEFERVHALALANDGFWCSAGVHPDEEDSREPTVEGLVALARLDKVVAIGETGLDYYRLAGRELAEMEWQRERFRVHIRAARASGRPLVIHTRSASADTLRLISGGAGRRGGRRLPLLHRDGRGREGRARPRVSHLVLGDPDLQEREPTCATSPPSCRSTAA